MNIKDFREQYPEYNDLSDPELTRALHKKYSSGPDDMSMAEFEQKFIGTAYPTPETPTPEEPSMLQAVARPFITQGAKAAEFLNRGVGGFSQNLAEMGDYANQLTGGTLSKGGAFDRAAEMYIDNADYWKGVADKYGPTKVDEIIGQAAGGAVPGMAEFMLGPGYAALTGAKESAKRGDSAAKGAVIEGAKRYLMGKVLEPTMKLSTPLRAGAMGGTFGSVAAAEGGDIGQVAEQAAIGALMGLPGGKGMGARDIRNLRKPADLTAPETLPGESWIPGRDMTQGGSRAPLPERTFKVTEETSEFTMRDPRTGATAKGPRVDEAVTPLPGRVDIMEKAGSAKKVGQASYDPVILTYMHDALFMAEPGKRTAARAEGDEFGTVYTGNKSTFPEWAKKERFEGAKYEGKEFFLKALDKARKGQPISKREHNAIDYMYNMAKEQLSEMKPSDRATWLNIPQAEISPAELNIGDTVKLGGEKHTVIDSKDIDPDGFIAELTLKNGQTHKVRTDKGIEVDVDAEGKPIIESLTPKLDEMLSAEREQLMEAPPVGMSIQVPLGTKGKQKPYEFSDKEMEAKYQASEAKKTPLWDSIKQKFTEIKHGISRGAIADLPRGNPEERAYFAPLRDSLIFVKHRLANASVNKAIAMVEAYRAPFVRAKDVEGRNLMDRLVMLRDFKWRSEQGQEMPFEKYKINKELFALENHIKEARPDVLTAIEKRKQRYLKMQNDYIDAYKEIGIDYTELFKNPDYMRHQVIDYLDKAGTFGSGQKLGVPKHGWQKKAEGSTRLVSKNVGATDAEVFAQMMHDIEYAKTIKLVQDNYNIANKVFEGIHPADLGAMMEYVQTSKVPEGYIPYKIKGVRSGASSERDLLDVLQTGIKDEFGIDIASRSKEGNVLIVRKEVAKALDKMKPEKIDNVYVDTWAKANGVWKTMMLFTPWRLPKYSFRNYTGDAEPFVRGVEESAKELFKKAPALVKESGQATKDLYDYYVLGKKPDATMQEWMDRGGLSGLMPYQEIAYSFNDLPSMRRITAPSEKSLWEKVKTPYTKYKDFAFTFNDVREGSLRLAAYRTFLKQMSENEASGKGARPNSFAASFPEEVMALPTKEARAFKLANELLGAYDDRSLLGQTLSKFGIVPFASFPEVNFRREIRMIRNQVLDAKTTKEVLQKGFGYALTKSPYLALRAMSYSLKAMGMMAALTAWNRTVTKKEEGDLPLKKQTRSHINFGGDVEGNVYTFDAIGSFSDLMSMFGADAAPELITKMMQGRIGHKEAAKQIAKAPVNYATRAAGPALKFPVEMATKSTLYPDVFNPRKIRDRGEYATQQAGMPVGIYRKIAGLPQKQTAYVDDLISMFVYITIPGEAALSDLYDFRADLLKRKGKYTQGGWDSPKATAAYHYRKAIMVEDKIAEEKYKRELIKYVAEKGQDPIQSIMKSTEALHPLYGMSEQDKLEFFAEMQKNPWLADRYKLAMEYLNKVLGEGGKK